MADLLGSILGKMQSPPGLGEEEKKKAKEQKRRIEKIHQLEKEKLSKFREKMQKEIGEFVKDSTKEKHKFLPMEKTYRAVLHEVAEIAGLVTFSFGDEDIDRYVMVWKKEFAPSDDELTACRKGEEWDPEKAKQLSRLKAEENQETSTATSATVTPQSNYKDKYERIIGKDSAKDAAKLTLTNRSYGFVSSENKRDRRTIEEVLAESKAKKKLKTDDLTDTPSSECLTSANERTDHDRQDAQ